MTQRQMMRQLISAYGNEENRVCAAYAKAERDGKVRRKSNEHDLSAEEYAHALFRDGARKGWF